MAIDVGNKLLNGTRTTEGGKDLWTTEQGKWQRSDAGAKVRKVEQQAAHAAAMKSQQVTAERAARVQDNQKSGVADSQRSTGTTHDPQQGTPTSQATTSKPAQSQFSGTDDAARQALASAAKRLHALVTTTRQQVVNPNAAAQSAQQNAMPKSEALIRTPPATIAQPQAQTATTAATTNPIVPPSIVAQTAKDAGPRTTQPKSATPRPATPRSIDTADGDVAARLAESTPDSDATTSSDDHPIARERAEHAAAKQATTQSQGAMAGALASGVHRTIKSEKEDLERVNVDAVREDDPAAVHDTAAQAGLAGAAMSRSARGQRGETQEGITALGGEPEEYPLDDPYMTGATSAADAAFRQVQQRAMAFDRHVVQRLAVIADEVDEALIPIVRSLQDRVDGPLKDEFLALMRRGDSPYGPGTRIA